MYDPIISPGIPRNIPIPQTYWQGVTSTKTPPAFTAPVSADVVIIGAGYTGLSAAIELAQHQSLSVVVLDAAQPGFGCSARNAGFVLKGTGRLSLNQIAQQWGHDIAHQMGDEFDLGVRCLAQLLAQGKASHYLQPSNYLKVAFDAKALTALESQCCSPYSSHLSLLTGDQVRDYLRLPNAIGGVLDTTGQTVNPLGLLTTLQQLAHQLGVITVYQSPVKMIETLPKYHNVITEQRCIRAANVLVTTNAYTPKRFYRHLDNKQFPIQSSILVTAPLATSEAVTPRDIPVSAMDTRLLKYYYRTLPDGRLLFGGRGEVTAREGEQERAKERLRRGLVNTFGQLANTPIDYFWNGWISASRDHYPRIRFDRSSRIGYSAGYCGSGVSFATLAGKRLAQALVGTPLPNLPIYQSDLPSYLMGFLRRPALRALYGWTTLRNRAK